MGFPYKTYMDRVITDEKGNILFGEKPGNIYDEINDSNQKEMIQKLQNQIINQQTQINKMDIQIQKQTEQLTKQDEQIAKQVDQIANQETAIQELIKANTKNDTQITNQNEIKTRLDSEFDVIINDNVMELYGNSADSKPTSNIKIGTTFYEYDTKNVYMYTGIDWVMI